MDWKTRINYLTDEAGMTQGQIAEEIGSSQSHVSDLASGKRGKRLGFEIGQRLVALYDRKLRAANRSRKAA